MIGEVLIVLEVAAVQAASAESAPGPFGVAAVSEDVLAEQRGGFRLPNGIDVSLSIDTVTAIDGRVVLQTVTRVAESAPVVTAYAPSADEAAVSVRTGQSAAQASAPQVVFDPQHGVTVSATIPSVAVTISPDSRNGVPAAIPGLQAVDLDHAAPTPDGVVQRVHDGGRDMVALLGADFSVMHLTGSALGATVLNTADDRAILTSTTLSIDLRNAGSDVLGSAMLRVEDIGILAVGSRY